ncbi:unnamed protein product [Didymodactylos carnosus]|uniref:IQ calmodulin-binding motif-containing protein 1 n=1 Tax=Didymodactylos carnosus TaxID=1234261 RepID=A0A813R2G5_9BILA|nr:unnamed protein product [Didymodactylos carnosus]CAF0774936.1 unnamed protein product [Didymodactylos carnosus]CAF3505766.1 unnamed protein product [Didymodactylos carnosus]CAF3557422.1 unnamed protein product [Didymodactylos carnosus]
MNPSLVSLAKELSRISPDLLPEKFLSLENLLQKSNEQIQNDLKQEIISLEILPVLLLTLRQDFTRISDGWRLASMNFSCMCVDMGSSKNKKQNRNENSLFYNKYIPQGIDSFLLLARHLQDRLYQERKADMKNTYLVYIRSVLNNLLELLAYHSNLPLIKQGRKINGTSVFGELSPKLKQDYVNEMAYKLTVFDNNDIGRAAIRTLLIVCETDSTVVSILAEKFKGLPTALQRWQGRGFGMDLQDLLAMLRKRGTPYSKDTQRSDYAATRIQALWRGYLVRKKLTKASKSFRNFHMSFRKRKMREAQAKEQERYRAEVQYQAVRDHFRRLRAFKLQQMKVIQLLPASEVEKYLETSRLQSATKIQAFVRGNLQRKKFNQTGHRQLVRERAARLIQRYYRQYQQRQQYELDKRMQRLEFIKPTILTEAKREELLEQIEQWRHERAPKAMSNEEFHALHNRTQNVLSSYVSTNRAWRKVEQRQRSVLLMMNNDTDLLMTSFPKIQNLLKSDTPSDQNLTTMSSWLTHPSKPVRHRAREDHIKAMRYSRAPWYKSLYMYEDGEDLYEKMDEMDEFDRNDILNNPYRYDYEKRKFVQFNTPRSQIQRIQRIKNN